MLATITKLFSLSIAAVSVVANIIAIWVDFVVIVSCAIVLFSVAWLINGWFVVTNSGATIEPYTPQR